MKNSDIAISSPFEISAGNKVLICEIPVYFTYEAYIFSNCFQTLQWYSLGDVDTLCTSIRIFIWNTSASNLPWTLVPKAHISFSCGYFVHFSKKGVCSKNPRFRSVGYSIVDWSAKGLVWSWRIEILQYHARSKFLPATKCWYAKFQCISPMKLISFQIVSKPYNGILWVM